jgi:hypothetical protein
MADDYRIFRAAHEGDYGPLVELLRSEAEITPKQQGCGDYSTTNKRTSPVQ